MPDRKGSTDGLYTLYHFSLFHCYVFYKGSTLDSHQIVNTDYWLVRRAVGVGCQAGVRRPSLAAGCHEGSLSGQLWVESTGQGSISSGRCRHRCSVITSPPPDLALHTGPWSRNRSRQCGGLQCRQSLALECLEDTRGAGHQPDPSWHLGSGLSLSSTTVRDFPSR